VQQHPPGDAFRATLARDLSSALLAHTPPGAMLSVQATVVQGCLQFMALTRTLGGVPAGLGAAGPQGLPPVVQALRASLPPEVAQGDVRVCFGDERGQGDGGPAGTEASSSSSSSSSSSRALSVADLQVSYVWPPCLVCGPPGGKAQVEVVLEPKPGASLAAAAAAAAGGGAPPAAGRLAEGAVGVRLVVVQGGAAVADVQAALPWGDLRVRWAGGSRGREGAAPLLLWLVSQGPAFLASACPPSRQPNHGAGA
jgi:hypothetical protein